MKTFFRNILLGSSSITLSSKRLDFDKEVQKLHLISDMISQERKLSKEDSIQKYFIEYFFGQLLTFILSLIFIGLTVLTCVYYNDYVASIFAIFNFLLLIAPKIFYRKFAYISSY